MPTPREGYFLADGKRVPGVTTIIGRFKESGGLIHWAWTEGKEGRDYRETSKAAADAGTLAHAMVEAKIRDLPGPDLDKYPEDVRVKGAAAYGAFLTWADQSRLKVIYAEPKLVSERHRFGGTPDAIIELDGKLSLGDWKSGNAVYADHLIQIAAYKNLWEEVFPDRPIEGGYHLCRFSKEHGDFAHHFFPNLDEAWEMFLLYRRAYDIDKDLKKRAA